MEKERAHALEWLKKRRKRLKRKLKRRVGEL